MDLIQVEAYAATVRLYPGDCAALAEMCDLGDDKYIHPEDEPKAQAARTYAAAFRALAVAGVALNNLLPLKDKELAQDLAGLQLAGFVRRYPGAAKKEVKE